MSTPNAAAEELADALKREGDRESSIGFYRNAYWLPIAERIVAAGWRPPARVITERADLDTLPPRSVVIDACEDEILCRTEDGKWAEFGTDIVCTSAVVWLPATVLYTPTEETTR